MKIAHIIGFYEPRLTYQEHLLSQYQAAHGHDVAIITSQYPWPTRGIEKLLREAGHSDAHYKESQGVTRLNGVAVYRLPTWLHYSDFVFVRELHRTLRQIRPDIVIAHEAKTGMTAYAAKYKKKLAFALVFNQHDFYHHIHGHPVWKKVLRYVDYFWFRKYLVSYALSRADAILSPISDVTVFLTKRNGIARDRITEIPLGIDTSVFTRSEEGRQRIRQQYGIQPTDVVLIFSGRIDQRKNIEAFLKVAGALIRQHSLWVVLAGGGGSEYMHTVRQYAKNVGLGERLLLPGFVEKKTLVAWLSAADLAVFAGNNSISIMEAMACGLPIAIAKMQLGYLATKANGRTFPAGDSAALQAILTRLFTVREQWRRMGEASRDIAVQTCSANRRAEKITTLCQQLVAKHLAGR